MSELHAVFFSIIGEIDQTNDNHSSISLNLNSMKIRLSF